MTNILFLGNCQINAMRGIARGMFPHMPCDFRTITPYWGTFDEVEIRARLARADLVISQAIANPDTPLNVADVRAATQGQVVFLPYIYIDGIAGLEIVASKGKSVIRGAEAIVAAWQGRKTIKVLEDYVAGRIDMGNAARVTASLTKLAANEAAHCDIVISDYIAGTLRSQPALWAINHPTQHILFEMFRRLCDHVGWRYDAGFRDNLVAWDQRALPKSTRALSPYDVDALRLSYPHDTHWFGQANKMITQAIKQAQQAAQAPRVAVPVASHPGYTMPARLSKARLKRPAEVAAHGGQPGAAAGTRFAVHSPVR